MIHPWASDMLFPYLKVSRVHITLGRKHAIDAPRYSRGGAAAYPLGSFTRRVPAPMVLPGVRPAVCNRAATSLAPGDRPLACPKASRAYCSNRVPFSHPKRDTGPSRGIQTQGLSQTHKALPGFCQPLAGFLEVGLDHGVWVEVRSIAWHLSKDSLDRQPHFVEDRLSVPWFESEEEDYGNLTV